MDHRYSSKYIANIAPTLSHREATLRTLNSVQAAMKITKKDKQKIAIHKDEKNEEKIEFKIEEKIIKIDPIKKEPANFRNSLSTWYSSKDKNSAIKGKLPKI